MPNRLQKAIAAIKDQTSISLAKVNISSSNLQVAVLKATTHDELPIDERYVSEILNLISSDKTYASSCARAICKRITRTHNWIVALKSLMLVLRIFQDGDPYFPREILHASKRRLNLSDFSDYSKSNPWDYTGFIRTFGLYLEERLECFLTGKLQRRYTHNKKDGSNHFRRKNNDSLRDMKPAMLLDKIVYWQRLLQRAIATRPTGIANDNQLVKISCYAVVKESFDLYRDISDGLALLLDNVLALPNESRISILEICVNAKKLFEELDEFYTVCIEHGVGKSLEYPTVQVVSKEVIETLQELLKDQTASQTPEKALVLSGDSLLSRRNQSYGEESAFSGFSSATEKTSDKASESGSEWESPEEILIATEAAKSPSISVDLKASSAQSEKTCATGSSPTTNSVADLSFNDWQANSEHKKNQEKDMNQNLLESTSVNELSNSSSSNTQSQPASSKIREFAPAESVTPSSNTQSQSLCASKNPQAQDGFDSFSNHRESGSDDGWGFAIAQTPTHQQSPHQTAILPNIYKASTAYTLHSRRQPQRQLTPINHDNSFLEDLYDIPANNPCMISYLSQNQAVDTNNPFTQTQALNDPFKSRASTKSCPTQVTISRDEYYSLLNQQYLLQQQLLMLNKMITRHATIA